MPFTSRRLRSDVANPPENIVRAVHQSVDTCPCSPADAHREITRVVTASLDAGAEPDYAHDYEGSELLVAAATLGNEGAVQVLVERGASVNAQDLAGKTALHAAVIAGQ